MKINNSYVLNLHIKTAQYAVARWTRQTVASLRLVSPGAVSHGWCHPFYLKKWRPFLVIVVKSDDLLYLFLDLSGVLVNSDAKNLHSFRWRPSVVSPRVVCPLPQWHNWWQIRQEVILNATSLKSTPLSDKCIWSCCNLDIWPWKPCQQCPLICWIIVASFIDIRPLRDITSHKVGVNGLSANTKLQ